MRRLLHSRNVVYFLTCIALIGVSMAACGSADDCPGICDPVPPLINLNVLASGQAGSDLGSLDPAHVTGALEYEIAHLVFPPLVALDANLKPID